MSVLTSAIHFNSLLFLNPIRQQEVLFCNNTKLQVPSYFHCHSPRSGLHYHYDHILHVMSSAMCGKEEKCQELLVFKIKAMFPYLTFHSTSQFGLNCVLFSHLYSLFINNKQQPQKSKFFIAHIYNLCLFFSPLPLPCYPLCLESPDVSLHRLEV